MSEKVLISRSESSIIRITRAVENCLPNIQAIYNELAKVIESPDLRVVRLIIDEKKPQNVSSLSNIIKQIIVEKMDNPTINGIDVKKDILIDYIEIPDVTPLFNAIVELQANGDFYNISDNSTRSYELENGTVSIFFDFQRVVRERFSYYTQNDKQVCFMEKANAFLDAVNALKPYIHYPSFFSKLKDVDFLIYNGDDHTPTVDESFVHRIV